MELAASVTEKTGEKEIKLRMIDNMSFNKEVTRRDMLGFKHAKGSVVLYTATKEACKQCSTNNKHEAPYCFVRKCNKCGLFGHTEPYCKQVVREANAANMDMDSDHDEEDVEGDV